MSVLSQATGVLVAVVATLGWVALAQGEVPPAGVLVWGAASGPGSGTGNAALYRGLARGEMSVVAPTSAVVTVLVPAAVGLGTGDRLAAAAWCCCPCRRWRSPRGPRAARVLVPRPGVRRGGPAEPAPVPPGLETGGAVGRLGRPPGGRGRPALPTSTATGPPVSAVLAALTRPSRWPSQWHSWVSPPAGGGWLGLVLGAVSVVLLVGGS